MKMSPNLRVRSFLISATVTIVVFATTAAFETSIASQNARMARASLDEATMTAALHDGAKIDSWAGEIDRRIAVLHLAETGSEQCAELLAALEDIAEGNHLRIMEVRRNSAMSVREKGLMAGDYYEVTFEGSYPHTLSALVALGRSAPLTRVATVTFEREGTTDGHHASVVRASLGLEIFRMGSNDDPIGKAQS